MTSSTAAAASLNESERDRLVLQHLPLVRAIAVRVFQNLPVHVDLDDMVHAGIMGLFDAAVKYDDNKQVTFQSYAKHRIKGAILDSLRNQDWASRDLRRRQKLLEQITQEFQGTLERNPTEQEVADRMGMDVERWRVVAADLRMIGLMSASARAPGSENQAVPEFPAKNDLNPDVLAGQRQLQEVLSVAVQALPARYQTVIQMYYSGGSTMREIGDKLGINESRVSQIHKLALEKMNNSLQGAGISSSSSLL
jgi:RNA polymerase sigma factor FliA